MNVPEGQNSTFWHFFRKKLLDGFIQKAENLGVTVLNGKSQLKYILHKWNEIENDNKRVEFAKQIRKTNLLPDDIAFYLEVVAINDLSSNYIIFPMG